MNFEPRYRYSTPTRCGASSAGPREEVKKGDFNPKMYNSFTDGTKAAIRDGGGGQRHRARLP